MQEGRRRHSCALPGASWIQCIRKKRHRTGRKHGVPSANVPRRSIYRFHANGKLSISGVPRRSCTCRTRCDDVHLPRSWPIVAGQSLYRGSDPRSYKRASGHLLTCAHRDVHVIVRYTRTHARARIRTKPAHNLSVSACRTTESIGRPRTCVKSTRFFFFCFYRIARVTAREEERREEIHRCASIPRAYALSRKAARDYVIRVILFATFLLSLDYYYIARISTRVYPDQRGASLREIKIKSRDKN